MNKRYKDIFKGDFGIVESIAIQIHNHCNENLTKPKNILMNDFDFELLKIEIKNDVNIECKEGSGTYVFGLRIYTSKQQDFGKFHIY